MRILALALIAVLGCTDEEQGDDAERGRVTVHVLRDELPVADAAIVFHDAQGRVLGTTRSDALGVAAGEISAGGMVTVFDPSFDQRLTTVTRVALGSTLEIPLQRVSAGGPAVRTVTIDAPVTAAPAETIAYVIQTPCWTDAVDSLPATIALPADCGPGTPIVLLARGPMQSLEDPGRSLAYVATRIDPDSVARPAAWSTTCTAVTLDAELEMALQLWPRFGNHAFRWLDLGFCAFTPPVVPTLDFSEGVVAHAFTYLNGSPLRTSSVLRDFRTVPSTVAIASDDLLRGNVDTLAFDGAGATWTGDPELAAADALDASLHWAIAPPESLVWRFLLPGNALGTVVPEIPDALDTWGTLADKTEIEMTLRYVDADWLDTLAGVHRELPLILDGANSRRDIPRGSTLRDYVESLHAEQN